MFAFVGIQMTACGNPAEAAKENNLVSVVFYCEKCLYLPVGNNNLG